MNEIIQLGNLIKESAFKNPQIGRIYSSDGISPTLNTCCGGGQEPKIITEDKQYGSSYAKNG